MQRHDGSGARRAMELALAQAGIKASDVQHRARREIEKASDATAAYVEQQPLKSVVIAAGIGAAAAALIMLLNERRR